MAWKKLRTVNPPDGIASSTSANARSPRLSTACTSAQSGASARTSTPWRASAWWIVFCRWRIVVAGGHPFPLEGGMRLGHEGRGVDGDAPLEALARLEHEVDQGLDIVVCLGGVADHEVELQLRKAKLLGQADGGHHLVFGLRFVDHVAQTLAAGFGRNGEVMCAGLRPGP